MRNSKSAYLFTYNNIWKFVYFSNINAVSIPYLLNTILTNKQTHNNRVLIYRYVIELSLIYVCTIILSLCTEMMHVVVNCQ